jgi:signal transduction histidine kinase
MKGAIVHIQRRRQGDPLIAEYTQLVSEEIDRLSNFVTDFLYLAKQSKPKLFPTDLNQLILSIESLFQKRAAELNIRLNNQLDPQLPSIAVDPGQMEQVFVNVLINAMDALPDGGDITFSSFLVKESDNVSGSEQVRIEIRDNGTGIAKDRLKSIFDPFFSTKESGTGLGLPISLGIVESHHGSMQVLPRQEKGAKVIIELPVNLDPLSRETDRAPSE